MLIGSVILICVLALLGVISLVIWSKHKSGPPLETAYVCDHCGHHHCTCRMSSDH